MTKRVLLLTLILAGCRDAQPPLPTTQQSARLNEAEAMLDELDNEEGPADRSTGPSNTSD